MSRTILQSNQPHIITQDSNMARNLFLYTRNEKISTHRQHIRVTTSSIGKHLAVQLQHTFPTQPPPPLDPLVTHAVTTMPQSEDMQAKEPQVIDLHTTFPSFKVKSHQLTATGEPKPKQLPLPCYSIVHSNHWADTICTFFTNKVLTYKLPIHSHKPSNPTPFHKYALTIGNKLIDKSTTAWGDERSQVGVLATQQQPTHLYTPFQQQGSHDHSSSTRRYHTHEHYDVTPATKNATPLRSPPTHSIHQETRK